MRKRDLDRLLEKAVADALGLSLNAAAPHHRSHRGPRAPRPAAPVITTRYQRVPHHTHA